MCTMLIIWGQYMSKTGNKQDRVKDAERRSPYSRYPFYRDVVVTSRANKNSYRPWVSPHTQRRLATMTPRISRAWVQLPEGGGSVHLALYSVPGRWGDGGALRLKNRRPILLAMMRNPHFLDMPVTNTYPSSLSR